MLCVQCRALWEQLNGNEVGKLCLMTTPEPAALHSTSRSTTAAWCLPTVATGWSTRVIMLSKPEMNTYIIHQALLIISPVLLAIVEYITLSKLVALGSTAQQVVVPVSKLHGKDVLPSQGGGCHQQHSSFAKFVKWFFTGSDVFCLLLQSSGGALYSNPDNAAIARVLLLIGLVAQLVFFSVFIGLTVFVQRSKRFGFGHDRSFRPVFICLYVTTLLMHFRNAFRVAEFAEGFGGNLASQEFYLFVFDFMPIFCCFLFFTAMHFGFWLGLQAPAMLARQGAKSAHLPVIGVHCG